MIRIVNRWVIYLSCKTLGIKCTLSLMANITPQQNLQLPMSAMLIYFLQLKHGKKINMIKWISDVH